MKKILLCGWIVFIVSIVLSQVSWARQTQAEAYEQAQKLHQLVLILYEQGKYAEAIPYAEEALAILEKAMGIKHPSVITVRRTLKELYRRIGDDSKAAQLDNQTLKTQEKTAQLDHRAYARHLNAQGLQLLYSERAMQDPLRAMFFAEAMFQEALSIQKKELGPDDPDVALTLNNLAKINLFEAVPLYQQALEIQEKALGSEHPLVAATLNNFAMSYRQLYSGSAYVYANPLYQQALAIQENVLGTEHPEVAKTLDNLAALNFERYIDLTSSYEDQDLDGQTDEKNGEDFGQFKAYFFNEALSHYKRSQQIYAQFVEQTLAFTTEEQQLNFLAMVTWQLHRFLSLISQNLSQNPAAAKDALDVWLRRKGLTLEMQKRFQEVLFKSDDPQAAKLEQQLKKVQEELNRLTSSELYKREPDTYKQKLTTLNARKDALQAQLIRLSLSYAIFQEIANVDTVKVARALEEQGSFQLTEQSLENLQNENIPEELVKELKSLVNRKITNEKTFWDVIEEYIGKEQTIRYKSLILKHAEKTYPVLLDFAKVDMFNYTERKDFTVEEKLGINVVWTNEKQWQPQPAHYFAFILHPGNGDNVQLKDLGKADEIDRQITELRSNIQHKEKDITLYQSVFKPLEVELGDATEIFISPDGNLNLIPFEVLMKPDGKYLIETYTFNYLAAGRDILRFRQIPATSHPSLLIGDPNFNFPSPEDNCPAPPIRDFTRLCHTKPEVEDIQEKLFGANYAAVLYTGNDAQEDVLLSAEAPRFLHLATHGKFETDPALSISQSGGRTPDHHSPPPPILPLGNAFLRSYIALAGANNAIGESGDSQGIVTAERILGLSLQGTEMVVLSACETGLGDIQIGEGVYGLRRAFLQAGAKSLVMSLWSVPDKETQDLMVQFYQNILSGKMTRVQALREAALEIKKVKPHPYYWGAFVFLGEP